MTSFQMIQIAMAVFVGNVMTICVIKGYQRMKASDRFDWITAGLFCGPMLATAAILTTMR